METSLLSNGTRPAEYTYIDTERKGLVLIKMLNFLNYSFYRILELHKDEKEMFSIDCMDPLGRSAIIMAIENENFELIQLLLHHNVKVKVN